MPNCEVFAFTVSHGDRRFLKDTVRAQRSHAGYWFDWGVYLGAPSEKALQDADALLTDPNRTGIQRLTVWPENRGQHHAFACALAHARAEGYRWILRLDDDVTPRTQRWLKRMLGQVVALQKRVGDSKDRLVVAPKIVGLRNPLRPIAVVEKGQTYSNHPFNVEVMEILGGACRLHPLEFLSEFEPPLYAPLGRLDPESMAAYVSEHNGLLLRFPNIRMVHRTDVLEARETAEQSHLRRMGHVWPYLGAEA